jgi:CDP-glucose 4,6-dehydratase
MDEDLYWKKQTVLVTGATGLVGSRLIQRLLERGSEVFSLVCDFDYRSELFRSGNHKHIGIFNGRLENYSDVERALNQSRVTTVIHLGAQPIVGAADRSPMHTFETNVQGTWNLLEACRRLQFIQSIVVASSDKAYGPCDVLPYTEMTPLEGRTPYEVSKSCADLISTAFHYTYEMPIAIARCGNIYGGGDLNFNRLVPGMFRSLLFNEVPIIRSDGRQIRDYIYVDDVVDAYLLLGENLSSPHVCGQSFNFSDETPLTVLEMYDQISSIVSPNTVVAPRILNQATKEIESQYLDSSKARQTLNWSPRTTLEEGLEMTYKWYRNFFDGLEK